MFLQALAKLGIFDLGSYFRQLWIGVVIGVFICAVGGAMNFGIKGLLLGAVTGLAAPVLLIWLAITLVHIAIHLAVFAALWIAITYCVLYVIRWWL
jgi:hypothetical protein